MNSLLSLSAPSPPTFDIIDVDEEWAILQWEPSRTGSPGSVFYVQYRARGKITYSPFSEGKC